jgi:hypothetical protein
MISLRAIQLFLKYFDGVDRSLSARVTRKHPWPEEALTAVFCDLMDSETQIDEGLPYNLKSLEADLLRTDEPIGVNVRIDTHQYSKHLEHHVTHSDIGIVVTYQDQFGSESFKNSWLLQAKRAFPLEKNPPFSYGAKSAFSSRTSEQESSLQALNEWAGFDFARYLLYCPRPSDLKPKVRQELNQYRSKALASNIFDYGIGLQLRDDLLSENPTTAAGVFVSKVTSCPKDLGETHQTVMGNAIPFSWFMVQHFSDNTRFNNGLRNDMIKENRVSNERQDLVEKLVRGDHRVLDKIDLPNSLSKDSIPRILPAHTIEIRVVCGLDQPSRIQEDRR